MSAHRYWRLRILSVWSGDAVVIGSLRMASSPGGANLAITGNGTASASSTHGATYAPDKAFDENDATWWGSYVYGNNAAFIASNPFVAWDFGSGVAHDIQEIKITSLPASKLQVGFGNSVRSTRLEYSDDGVTWVVHKLLDENPDGAGTTTHSTIVWKINGSLTAPSPHLTALSGGSAIAAAPSPIIVGNFGGSASIFSPPPNLFSTGRDSYGDYSAILSAPSSIISAFGGASSLVAAPKQILSSVGVVTSVGRASLESPRTMIDSSGLASAMIYASLSAPRPNLIGYGGAVVSVTISGVVMSASGTTGGIAAAVLECPLLQLSALATVNNYGGASLIAPSPEIGRTAQAWVVSPASMLTAVGTAVVAATHEAYAVNLLHRGGSTVDEVTHYTNFPFTHVVRYQNSYYGVNSTGLYLLEGTTDNGDPIEWAVQTAMEDFGSPRRKTVDSVYIEGRLGAATTVSLQSGEKTPNTYSHTTPRGATAQNHRQKLGRGVKERYHALGLAGDGEFELDAVEFNERETNRRI